MAIVTYDELAAQAGLTSDAPDEDQVILQQKGDAAQAHIESQIGFKIEERFGGALPPVPQDLKEGVLQLAAWWFANREALADSDKLLPFGVQEIIASHRDWTF
jgi:uncharacterized phiE125 gp8 family phage protein